MRQKRGVFRHGTGPTPVLLILAALAVPGYGAQFQFGTLVQAGFSGAINSGSLSLGAGNTAAANGAGSTTTWQSGQDRLLEIEYQKPTNTLEVLLYAGATATGSPATVTFNPTGGPNVAANATWTIPAASFFVTAASGPIQITSITLSNLTLSGVSGAINILQPIQQTTLTASNVFLGPTSTVTQTQDIVFTGDSTGSWILSGTLNLSGLALGATGNDLIFGFAGSAAGNAVPEPATLSLVGAGFVVLGLLGRSRNIRP